MSKLKFINVLLVLLSIPMFLSVGYAQKRDEKNQDKKVRTMTIPISIFTQRERKEREYAEFVEVGDLTVKEDNDQQVILSIRSVSSTPLAIAVLIQDDLSSNANLQLKSIADFIRGLPNGSRVMVAYLRGGTIQVRQKFTEDLEKAAKSLRIISGVGPSNPYVGVEEALSRFDALPMGRRAILLVSDGLDVSRGFDSASPTQSIDLDQAILKAQRKSVAVYSFYNATRLTENGSSILVSYGQGSLNRISDETGGRAFFQGTLSPVSFDPFFRDLNAALNRQFALSYLSTHFKKGFHRVEVNSTNPEVRIEYPKGYYYR